MHNDQQQQQRQQQQNYQQKQLQDSIFQSMIQTSLMLENNNFALTVNQQQLQLQQQQQQQAQQLHQSLPVLPPTITGRRVNSLVCAGYNETGVIGLSGDSRKKSNDNEGNNNNNNNSSNNGSSCKNNSICNISSSSNNSGNKNTTDARSYNFFYNYTHDKDSSVNITPYDMLCQQQQQQQQQHHHHGSKHSLSIASTSATSLQQNLQKSGSLSRNNSTMQLRTINSNLRERTNGSQTRVQQLSDSNTSLHMMLANTQATAKNSSRNSSSTLLSPLALPTLAMYSSEQHNHNSGNSHVGKQHRLNTKQQLQQAELGVSMSGSIAPLTRLLVQQQQHKQHQQSEQTMLFGNYLNMNKLDGSHSCLNQSNSSSSIINSQNDTTSSNTRSSSYQLQHSNTTVVLHTINNRTNNNKIISVDDSDSSKYAANAKQLQQQQQQQSQHVFYLSNATISPHFTAAPACSHNNSTSTADVAAELRQQQQYNRHHHGVAQVKNSFAAAATAAMPTVADCAKKALEKLHAAIGHGEEAIAPYPAPHQMQLSTSSYSSRNAIAAAKAKDTSVATTHRMAASSDAAMHPTTLQPSLLISTPAEQQQQQQHALLITRNLARAERQMQREIKAAAAIKVQQRRDDSAAKLAALHHAAALKSGSLRGEAEAAEATAAARKAERNLRAEIAMARVAQKAENVEQQQLQQALEDKEEQEEKRKNRSVANDHAAALFYLPTAASAAKADGSIASKHKLSDMKLIERWQLHQAEAAAAAAALQTHILQQQAAAAALDVQAAAPSTAVSTPLKACSDCKGRSNVCVLGSCSEHAHVTNTDRDHAALRSTKIHPPPLHCLSDNSNNAASGKDIYKALHNDSYACNNDDAENAIQSIVGSMHQQQQDNSIVSKSTYSVEQKRTEQQQLPTLLFEKQHLVAALTARVLHSHNRTNSTIARDHLSAITLRTKQRKQKSEDLATQQLRQRQSKVQNQLQHHEQRLQQIKVKNIQQQQQELVLRSKLEAEPDSITITKANSVMAAKLASASKSNNSDLVHALITEYKESNKIDASQFVNSIDSNGSSSLHHAAWPGHHYVIDILISRGALPDLRNNRGNTALHLACHHNRAAAIRSLIQGGSNPMIRNVAEQRCFEGPELLQEQIAVANIIKALLEEQVNNNISSATTLAATAADTTSKRGLSHHKNPRQLLLLWIEEIDKWIVLLKTEFSAKVIDAEHSNKNVMQKQMQQQL